MSYLLRQNPDNPCQLQQSTDNGTTWSLAFDYDLCTIVATGPEQTDVDDAVAGIIDFETGLVDIFVNNPGLTPDQIAVLLLDYVRGFDPEYDGNEAIQDAIEQASNTPSLPDYQNKCEYREQFDQLTDCMGDIASMTDLLNGMAQCLIDALNNLSDEMIKALNGIAAAMTQNGIKGFYQNRPTGGGAGFMADCEWVQVVDFTVTDGGFKAIPENDIYGCPLAVHEVGVGWRDNGGCTIPPGTPTVAIAIYRTFPIDAQITRMEFEPLFGSPSATEGYGFRVNGDNDCQISATTGSAVYLVSNFPDCPDVEVVYMAASNGVYSSIIIPQMEVRGLGRNPFV